MAQNNERSAKRDASYNQSKSASFQKSVSRSRSRGEHYSPLRNSRPSVSPHERQLNTQSLERPVTHSPPRAVLENNRSSPLRSKSHSKSPLRSPPKFDQHYEDNRQRMMKSQERIASLLGYNGANSNRGPSAHNQSIQQLLESKRSAGGLGSNYKNLVDRSHSNSKSPAMNRDIYMREPEPTTQFATSMVRQSLADLKSRLQQMRMEKQQVEQELKIYENHR